MPNAATPSLARQPDFRLGTWIFRETQAAAHSVGCNLIVLNASTESEIDAAFVELARQRVGGLIVTGDQATITCVCRKPYRDEHMESNNRYLDIPDNGKSRDIRIPADWFNPPRYESLKKTCKEWLDPQAELSIVSELFPAFSIAKSDLPAARARLLDIESRFPGSPKPAGAKPPKAQHMIDCLFLTADRTLVFVEVKRTANKEARGREQSEPAVIDQLQRYRGQLGSDRLRQEIRGIYAGVILTLGRILGRTLPVPRAVFHNVPLFIVGPASAPSPRAKEVWQRDLLAAPLSIESEIIGIDGRDERMIAALDDFFRALARKPAEAASQ